MTEWVGCLGLTVDDRKCIESNAWLTANHVSAASKLLRIQFPNQNGLQETTYLLEKSTWKSSPNDFVQIVYVNPGHWACVSNVFCTESVGDACTVDLFDSAHFLPSKDSAVVKQIATILHSKRHFDINLINVSRQFGGNDCGLFSIAMATDLVNRIDPFSVKYTQQLMRNHLKNCFQHLKILRFPNQVRVATLKRILCTFRVTSTGDVVKVSKSR